MGTTALSLRVTYDSKSASFRENFGAAGSAFARATTAASRTAADQIEQQGKLAIAAGGLGNVFQQSFHASLTTSGGAISNAVIQVSSDIPFFGIFDRGGTIKGKPLLWVPLSFGSKQRLSQYRGHLALVNRVGGKPLLIDVQTHIPQFVGLDAVQIRKRFDIASVIQNVMKEFPAMLQAEIKKALSNG